MHINAELIFAKTQRTHIWHEQTKQNEGKEPEYLHTIMIVELPCKHGHCRDQKGNARKEYLGEV